jgi:mono/diheme cytochrome c family protein/glucose/arabinose dehydrogenase
MARAGAIAVVLAAGVVTLIGGQGGSLRGRQWPPAVEPLATPAPVLPPAEALRTFSMPPGYRLELVASEPLIQDPIAIDWDPAGRLWAIELPGYMRDIRASGEYEPIGRIVVLEDSNGDGAMDRRTVFADGLIQPRAMTVLEQGVLVGEPPNIWLMRDTDGDLRSDRKDLVAAGYGRRETNVEVNANALLWGLDNRIHMAGTGADMVLRYVDRAFQVQRSLSRGQWGATQDDAGRIYRNHNESVLHVDLVATPYFARNPALLRTRGSHEALQDPAGNINDVWPAHQTPGTNRAYQQGLLRADGTLAAYTAACAPTVYRGDRLPAGLQGNVFVAEPTANVVSRFILADDGTTLRARKATPRAEFLSSTDERFRPVYLSNAPDGTLYVVDMYRGIIQHHAYITEYLRDQIASRGLEQPIGLGRIYRVVHDGTRRDRTALPAKVPSSQLVGLLSRASGWWRDTAQRLLVERGDQSVAPALTALVGAAPDWRTRVHALWTLDGLNAVTTATAAKALADSSRDVRVAAARVSERWLGEKDHSLQSRVIALGDDQDWAVRQQAVASMGALPPGLRERSIAAVLEHRALDPIVADTALSGLRGSEAAVLTMLLRREAERTPAREAAITVVAATIARSAEESPVLAMFESAADSARPEWQRAALLRGLEVALAGAAMPGPAPPARGPGAATMPCATCPGGRAGPGGAYAFPRPADWPSATGRSNAPVLRLTREPKPLTDLAAGAGELSARASALLGRVTWPGKTGDAGAAKPLTPAQQQQFDRGRDVYRTVCAGCHQPDGRGMDRIAPSLIGSPFALAPAEIPIRIVMHGKEGATGLMPPVGASLDDEQIASVLTYVRREWGQTADPIDATQVRGVRTASAGRTRPWTDAELKNR